MNRLTKKLSKIKSNNKKALVGYLVAGDPDIETTVELMKLFSSSGVDIIEIGVPFTDPIAEGPIIQKAHDRALKKDTSLISVSYTHLTLPRTEQWLCRVWRDEG